MNSEEIKRKIKEMVEDLSELSQDDLILARGVILGLLLANKPAA